MIRLFPPILHANAARYLTRWTHDLANEPDFTERVRLARERFRTRNRRQNKTFTRVKTALRKMSRNTDRCVYCEDSYADQIEHMHPKNIYPERCFSWENYVYACGSCNRTKSDHFSVSDTAGLVHVVTPPRRPGSSPRVPPVAGRPLFINPRTENPLDYLVLDWQTGHLTPHPLQSPPDRRRARWMIDTIGLNRGRLPKIRQASRRTFELRLSKYATDRNNGAPPANLTEQKVEMLSLNHQTVLQEMWRQRAMEPRLTTLFYRLPEVGTWW